MWELEIMAGAMRRRRGKYSEAIIIYTPVTGRGQLPDSVFMRENQRNVIGVSKIKCELNLLHVTRYENLQDCQIGRWFHQRPSLMLLQSRPLALLYSSAAG
jgi:hypothetical protein